MTSKSTKAAPILVRKRYILAPRVGSRFLPDRGGLEIAAGSASVEVLHRMPWGLVVEADEQFERVVRAKYPRLRLEAESVLHLT